MEIHCPARRARLIAVYGIVVAFRRGGQGDRPSHGRAGRRIRPEVQDASLGRVRVAVRVIPVLVHVAVRIVQTIHDVRAVHGGQAGHLVFRQAEIGAELQAVRQAVGKGRAGEEIAAVVQVFADGGAGIRIFRVAVGILADGVVQGSPVIVSVRIRSVGVPDLHAKPPLPRVGRRPVRPVRAGIVLDGNPLSRRRARLIAVHGIVGTLCLGNQDDALPHGRRGRGIGAEIENASPGRVLVAVRVVPVPIRKRNHDLRKSPLGVETPGIGGKRIPDLNAELVDHGRPGHVIRAGERGIIGEAGPFRLRFGAHIETIKHFPAGSRLGEGSQPKWFVSAARGGRRDGKIVQARRRPGPVFVAVRVLPVAVGGRPNPRPDNPSRRREHPYLRPGDPNRRRNCPGRRRDGPCRRPAEGRRRAEHRRPAGFPDRVRRRNRRCTGSLPCTERRSDILHRCPARGGPLQAPAKIRTRMTPRTMRRSCMLSSTRRTNRK